MPQLPLSQDALTQLHTGSTRYANAGGVMQAIKQAAVTTGARFDTLAATAAIESGMNPQAKASSSSATGLFQFVDQTWLATVKRAGAANGLAAQAAAITRKGDGYTVEDPQMRQEILDLRKDPKIAATMAADHLKDLSNTMAGSIGHTPDVTETYMGHFLGAGGAAQMIKALQQNPGQPASAVLPEAARANPAMFNGQNVAQFVNKVRGRVEQAYSDLGMPMPKGGLQLASVGTGAGGDAGSSDNGSDGWGKGTPVKLGTAPERLMLASLAEVFTKLDRNSHGHHGTKQAHTSTPTGAMPGAGGASIGT